MSRNKTKLPVIDLAEKLFEAVSVGYHTSGTAIVLRPACECLRKKTNPRIKCFKFSWNGRHNIHLVIMQYQNDRCIEISSPHSLDWVVPVVQANIPQHARIIGM